MDNKQRFRLITVGIAAVIGLACLYLSGISLLTIMTGPKEVTEREDMSKGNMQTITGEYMGAYMADESGTYGAVLCEDGLIAVLTDTKPEVGESITANGFVSVMDEKTKTEFFAWYDDNGDFSGGDEYFDNVSPLMIHDNHGRFFETNVSKVLTGACLICGVYMLIIYMGIRSGKYGE